MKKSASFFMFLFLLTFAHVIFANTLTVTDMAGREVTIPSNIERIVTTYKPATQFVFALNAQEMLVGVDNKSTKEKLFTLIYTDVESLIEVGSKREGVNIETIASLNPDLVILFPHNQAEFTAFKLETLGISTIIINPESLEEIRETNRLLGEILGLEDRAKNVDNQFDDILKLLEKAKNLPEDQKKVVYFANSQLLDTVGKNMMQTDIIKWAGGINPAAKSDVGFIKISPEQLIAWNPDVIVTSQTFQGDIEELYKEVKYQNVKAFKNKQIYRFPSILEPWDYPNPSSYLGMLWLATKIHPELFSDIDFDKVADEFYYTLYGVSYSELLSKTGN
ncbi:MULTISPECIES: ABC transporter substrate-binding protein [Petrotoga]|uniref:Iron complex transport system substrate-binding protein n=2 Tax=Petrotoga sibirica TaxID=156202 RepID=A0A4R8EWT8_9BACT|nr:MULTISPECIES: ABC transporter substrate-binding protein [Petrotoga]POZ88092.1 ABC transporter substrate-binding protein [Petrotoga sibirica DSM 13575]POZ90182.1 ABC transporter substrate-binding protein [Petrotoga sp. SL27]TDX17194.1 iron complex transport system substrate-binding protein [Petrotoga sibirica]